MATQEEFKKANDKLNQEIKKALANMVLNRTLGKMCSDYPAKREKSLVGVDWEANKEKLIEAKDYACAHVDELIDLFIENATKRGAKVFRARSNQEAMDFILKFAQDHDAKLIVKSKSMASEEIHMNEVLEEHGIDVFGADLGDFILQLDHNTPMHLVLPALYLNKEQVGDLFEDFQQHPVVHTIEEETNEVRLIMRDKFIRCDIGFSGCNCAIAETGTVCTMTNEGNGRMVATLPPVHLYLFGIEKLVKRFRDAEYVFRALPRNGTGQKITAYLSMYTGTNEVVINKETDEKANKEFQIVMMDTPERRAIANDPDFNKVWRCIRCASCQDMCPAFALVGGHAFGSRVYGGGIGVMLTQFLIDPVRADAIQNICLQCGRCKTTCAVDMPIPEMIMKLRKRKEEANPSATKKFALETVNNRKLFHSMLRIASVAQGPFTKGQPMIRHLPMFLAGMTNGRSLPAVAQVPFRDIFPTIEQKVDAPKGKIALYAGCLLDFVYPDIARDVILDLNSIGYTVDFPMDQGCCGSPAVTLADDVSALGAAQNNIEAMHAEDYDYIVSACPSCTEELHKYPEFFEEGSEDYKKAKEVADKTFDFCKLFTMLGGVADAGDDKPMKVTYHTSCHLNRANGIFDEPRELLKHTKGVEFVEMFETDQCCGFGGAYCIQYPEVSQKILEKKIKYIEETGADTVAVDCPGCLMQIKGGLDAAGSEIKTKHTASIIAEKRGLV